MLLDWGCDSVNRGRHTVQYSTIQYNAIQYKAVQVTAYKDDGHGAQHNRGVGDSTRTSRSACLDRAKHGMTHSTAMAWGFTATHPDALALPLMATTNCPTVPVSFIIIAWLAQALQDSLPEP